MTFGNEFWKITILTSCLMSVCGRGVGEMYAYTIKLFMYYK